MKLLPTFRSGALTLRPFDAPRDSNMVLEWRNKPRVRAGMFRQELITPEEHALFVGRYNTAPDDFWFIAEDAEGPVGAAALLMTGRDDWAEFGRLMIGEERALGRAYGAQITLGLVHFAFKKLHLKALELAVKQDNKAALRGYLASGFVDTGRKNAHGAMVMSVEAPEGRAWERWDDGNVTDAIVDHCWANGAEVAHRDRLAALALAPGWGDGVLEVGCGSGLLAQALVRGGMPAESYMGIDTSYRMLARAYAAEPKLSFAVGDIFKLKGSHSTVVCAEVLGHLPDWREPFAHLCRVAQLRTVISLWLANAPREGVEEIAGSKFLYRCYSRKEVVAEARKYGRLIKEVDLGLTTALVIEK